MNKPILRWLLLLAAALPAIVPLFIILRYGADFRFWDDWDPDMAGFYVKAHAHQLTFSDFVAQHNEHRILFPRIVYFLISAATRGNNVALMFGSWVVVCITSGGILRIIQKTVPNRPPSPAAPVCPAPASNRVLLLWFLCNLLVFSPTQFENWLWSMGLANFMPMLFVIVALIAGSSSQRPWMKVGLVILFCSAATYSSGNGGVCWPLAATLLAWSASRAELKSKIWQLSALAAAFVLNVSLYFIGYIRPDYIQHAYSGGIGQMIEFWLTFLGGSFASSTAYSPPFTGMIVGTAMLLLIIVAAAYFLLVWRRYRDYELCARMLVWFAVAGYAMISGALAAASRVGFGAQLGAVSRYVSFSLYLPIALMALAVLICDDVRRRNAEPAIKAVELAAASAGRAWLTRLSVQVPAVLGGMIVLSQLLSLHSVAVDCAIWQSFCDRGKGALLLAKVLPDNPLLTTHVYVKVDLLLKEEAALEEIGYLHPPLIQSNNASVIEASETGFADGNFETAGRNAAGQLVCSGWAVFPTRNKPADAVFLTYDNERKEPIIFVAASPGMARNDIADRFQNPSYSQAGWLVTCPLDRLPANMKTINLSAWVLDAQTGKACKLAGGGPIPR